MKSRFSAPAKLNLSLAVTGRREDGYHTLRSLIVPTTLGDTLDVVPAPEFTLTVEGLFAVHAPGGEDNLVARAVRALERMAGRAAALAMILGKNCPAGAGLGAGSADAAAAMRVVNAHWGKPFDDAVLARVGLEIGAELPFCLMNRAARVTGIGEIVEPVTVAPLDVVVVWPGIVLATGAVFAAYEGAVSIVPENDLNPADWRNDLEPAARGIAPVIGTVLDALQAQGAAAARMTGSGSACFGVFDDGDMAARAAAVIAAAYPEWWVRAGRTL
ncbi:MAG: 4-(cytidine 5'-diphospho)-2-C-methyl-D-erythritol kinase [Rhodospirillales bacterium]|nr:4-(cytidine 5'-diphospho)-2-C-methyl-D-erythritol kinase [Alphaproteobacteria bacterium]MCB9986792.1 4-(cytidine 5'-diphospho)-2-C-methyl-D-erythritol kinase [Rhodospirillales bacterium]USO08587.1 MAG: 4-(cytidine 5'-diphospho)-2-C-methyl-D-erythritol kinase [Rhodospirillales bacterium]